MSDAQPEEVAYSNMLLSNALELFVVKCSVCILELFKKKYLAVYCHNLCAVMQSVAYF